MASKIEASDFSQSEEVKSMHEPEPEPEPEPKSKPEPEHKPESEPKPEPKPSNTEIKIEAGDYSHAVGRGQV